MEENQTEQIQVKSAIVRNHLGHIQKGSAGLNLIGRPKLGVAHAEKWRRFLQGMDREKGKRRERVQMELVYEMSVDPKHRYNLEAIKYSQLKAYGEPAKEVGQSVLAAILLQSLPADHKAYLAQMLYNNDRTLLPALDSEDELDLIVEDSEETENEDTDTEVNE